MLPCITLCPLPGFRNLYDFAVDIASYLNDTFGKEDIFQQEMLERLNDSTKWISQEIFTTIMGRCWMTCFQKEVKVVSFAKDFQYDIKTKKNYQVSIQ